MTAPSKSRVIQVCRWRMAWRILAMAFDRSLAPRLPLPWTSEKPREELTIIKGTGQPTRK